MKLLADGNGPAVLETPTITEAPVASPTTTMTVVPTLIPEVKGSTLGSTGLWVLLVLIVVVIGGWFLSKKYVNRVK